MYESVTWHLVKAMTIFINVTSFTMCSDHKNIQETFWAQIKRERHE